MHIKLTYHGHIQRWIRSFTPEEIKQVIRNPDYTRPEGDGKTLSMKKFPDRALTVIYAQRGKLYIIISVF